VPSPRTDNCQPTEIGDTNQPTSHGAIRKLFCPDPFDARQ
jgi:hypothetical protein